MVCICAIASTPSISTHSFLRAVESRIRLNKFELWVILGLFMNAPFLLFSSSSLPLGVQDDLMELMSNSNVSITC